MTNLSKFKILFLAAGVGRRFGKKGKIIPKSLISIRKKTLIENIVQILKKRKAKEISIILGYKSKKIIKVLRKIQGIKFNFINIKDFRKNNHGCSWHHFKKYWYVEKKPMLLLHTDISFNPKFLDNIIKSKKKDIIGIHSNKNIMKDTSLVIKANKEYQIKEINLKTHISNNVGEVIGINKISPKTNERIFNFMDKFLKGKNKKLPWELVINKFIKITNFNKFSILKNQNYFWINVNYNKDYLNLKNKKNYYKKYFKLN